MSRVPEYDPSTDGNVFEWIVSTAAAVRHIETARREAPNRTPAKPRPQDQKRRKNISETM